MNEHSLLDKMSKKNYTKSDVKLLGKENLYTGFFQCNKYRLKHKLFSGGWSEEIQREIFERGHAAAVLLYDVKNDKVVLLEQFRLAALETPESPWLFEIVAGMIEKGESPIDVAKREALEEAGLEIKSCQFITRFLASPGGSNEMTDLFVADVDSELASGVHGLEEEGEDIRVHVLPRETAYQWVIDGKINNASAIIALQWLELNWRKGLKV